MGLTIVTAPAREPLDYEDEVKDHLRLDADTEQAVVEQLITAARVYAENHTGRTFINTTYDYTVEKLASTIELPRSPVSSITSLKVFDEDDVETTIAASEYRLDITDEIPKLVKKANGDFGTTTLRNSNPVVVRFVAGYGTSPTDVPETIRAAMKILVSHWFENRELALIGGSVNKIPLSAEALLEQYKLWRTL